MRVRLLGVGVPPAMLVPLMLLLGGVVVYFVAPVAYRDHRQSELVSSGTAAPARILSAERTSVSFNNRPVWELDLMVVPEGARSWRVQLAQALPSHVEARLRQVLEEDPTPWAKIRYDPAEPEFVALDRVGVSAPSWAGAAVTP